MQDELRYDRFHTNYDRIYSVSTNIQSNNSPDEFIALTSRPVGQALKEFPEIEHVVRLNKWNPVLKKDNELFYDDNYFFAESEFFKVFSFDLLEGDPETALEGVNRIVITESMEEKYFENKDAFGKTLVLNDTNVFEITGVMKDVPAQSHVTFDFLVSYESLLKVSPVQEYEWLSLSTYSYILLDKNADAQLLKEKVRPLINDNFGEQLKSVGYTADVDLEPLSDLYLYSKKSHGIGVAGDIKFIYIFSAVALFILILACINFMNLSTARSLERAREVGVRKVLGSSRSHLIRQFLGESIITTIICLIFALTIVAVVIPGLNDLSGKNFSLADIVNLYNIIVIVGLIVFVGILAGLYPAFVLSSFNPARVLKGTFKTNSSGIFIRKALTVFQFIISIGLLIGAVIAYEQLKYMQDRDLGFDKSNMLIIDGQRMNPGQRVQYETAKNELSSVAGVKAVTASGSVPGKETSELITTGEGLPEGESIALNILPIDYDFIDAYNIEISTGRNFSKDITSDASEAFLINQAAVHKLGYKSEEEAIGKELTFANKKGKVVGIVRDFNYFSLKKPMTAMLFVISPQAMTMFSCKLETGNLNNAIAQLEEKWQSIFPGYTFQYSFLDEDFDKQYIAEQKMNKVLGVFTLLAILIACFGFFGLVAFTISLKTKEIVVRKVLGASEQNILLMLGSEFGRLILIAYVVAVPSSWYLMNIWLEDFSYRFTPGAEIFIYAGLLTVITAAITISSLAIKAAWANPVTSLKSE